MLDPAPAPNEDGRSVLSGLVAVPARMSCTVFAYSFPDFTIGRPVDEGEDELEPTRMFFAVLQLTCFRRHRRGGS